MSTLTSNIKPWVLKLAPIFPYLKRMLHRFHGGVFPAYKKELSARHPIRPTFIPEELILPLQQYVGQTAKPIVKPGDRVLKNQKIADIHKGFGTPIHAPTSGTIIAIESRTLPHPSGLKDICIVIKPDSKDEAIENALKCDGNWPENPEKLKQTVLQAGIVGMGGAGFPTYAKIPNQKGKIHTLIINGAECEPYITCDDLLMQTQPEQILTGALIVAKALGVEKILCGIEDNKLQAIQAMQKAAKQLQKTHSELNLTIEIITVPTVYPMGGQKQLTYQLTGVEVSAKAHAVDIGILMMNVATFAAIENAIEHGNPLTTRLVTVTGDGVENAFNIPALLGTPFDSLVKLAKPKQPLDFPLIMGGPMMGFEVQDNQVPVIKTTNCILTHKPFIPETVLPCIRCGECMDACPVNLLPQQLYWYSRSEEWDKVEQHHVWDCIECGCCSYVCPSNIPLVQYYRYAKSEIKLKKEAEHLAEKAKRRHEQRLARIEKEKQEREARLKAKKEAIKKKAASESSEKAAKDAKSPSPATENGQKTPLSARERAIQAAKARASATKQAAKKNALADKPVETPAKNTVENTADKSKATLDAKRKAAMAAAKARAAAAKKAANKTPEPSKAPETSEQKVSEAKAQTPEDKRAAAMAAAKARAEALRKKKAQEKTQKSDITEKSETPSTEPQKNKSEAISDDDKAAKRAAAMAAAKARAEALRKKKAAQTATPSNPEQES